MCCAKICHIPRHSRADSQSTPVQTAFSNPDSAGMAVCSYFYEAMPEGISVERLERWESQVQDGV